MENKTGSGRRGSGEDSIYKDGDRWRGAVSLGAAGDGRRRRIKVNFAHYFDRLCQKAGLGHWHPHELRHSAASIMLAQGTPLWVVSEILGHASIAITKDVHGHLLGGEKQAATEAITDVLFSPSDEVTGSRRRTEDG